MEGTTIKANGAAANHGDFIPFVPAQNVVKSSNKGRWGKLVAKAKENVGNLFVNAIMVLIAAGVWQMNGDRAADRKDVEALKEQVTTLTQQVTVLMNNTSTGDGLKDLADAIREQQKIRRRPTVQKAPKKLSRAEEFPIISNPKGQWPEDARALGKDRWPESPPRSH